MVKYIWIKLGLLLFLGVASSACFSETIKQPSQIQQEITILDKGIKRRLIVPSSQISAKSTVSQLQTQEGVVVQFKDNSLISIQEFEATYDLRLRTTLLETYYVFDNLSKLSDVQLVGKIIAGETNLLTVKPNWKLQNSPR
jgi:hypothetical protein